MFVFSYSFYSSDINKVNFMIIASNWIFLHIRFSCDSGLQSLVCVVSKKVVIRGLQIYTDSILRRFLSILIVLKWVTWYFAGILWLAHLKVNIILECFEWKIPRLRNKHNILIYFILYSTYSSKIRLLINLMLLTASLIVIFSG